LHRWKPYAKTTELGYSRHLGSLPLVHTVLRDSTTWGSVQQYPMMESDITKTSTKGVASTY
jgi:hypothetical protein